MLTAAATTLRERSDPFLARPQRWRAAVIAVAAGGFLVRLLIIAVSHGGNDLANYTYFARLALHGHNPFNPPAGGPFGPALANSPPLEYALFAGLLSIRNSPDTLRVLFALTDVTIVLVVGLLWPRPRPWRAAFILFYAFNPLVLVAWTVYAEDKTLLFLGIVLLLLAIERGREWFAWAAVAALAAFKFLGVFTAPVLGLHSLRTRGRAALWPIAAFVAVVALSNLPWFPKSLDAFSRRNDRLAINPPIHASPTLLLARLGIYAPIEAKLLTAAGILAVLVMFAARRLALRDAVVWSLFAGYVFLPDDAFDRLLLITLPFLLLLELSATRWALTWFVSTVAALADAVATRGVPHALSGLGDPLRTLFAHEATVRHVLWMSALPVLVLAFYALDRRAAPRARSNASAIAS